MLVRHTAFGFRGGSAVRGWSVVRLKTIEVLEPGWTWPSVWRRKGEAGHLGKSNDEAYRAAQTGVDASDQYWTTNSLQPSLGQAALLTGPTVVSCNLAAILVMTPDPVFHTNNVTFQFIWRFSIYSSVRHTKSALQEPTFKSEKTKKAFL